MLSTHRFRHRPTEATAVQLVGSDDGQAARTIATWCNGHPTGTYQRPRVLVEMPNGVIKAAQVGDWIIHVRDAAGARFLVLPDAEFRAAYEEVDPT